MQVTQIFDNGRGDKFEVNCRLSVDSCGDKCRWQITVFKKPKGKRKFVPIPKTSDDELRNNGIPFDERENYRYLEYLKEIPWSWVIMVQDELIAKIKESANSIYPKD